MKNLENASKLRPWFILLLPVLVISGLLLVSPASAQEESTSPLLTVVAGPVKVRSGPDATYPDFETLEAGDFRGVIGYNPENGWWQVVSIFGSPGWVSGEKSQVSVNEVAIRQFVAPEPPPAVPAISLPSDNSGSTIVFQTSTGGPIYAVDPDGANLRYLTTGLDPALSPDGQWLTFARWETSQDGALGSLWLINVNGTGERVIMNNVHNPRTPVWSPDGSQIVLSFQDGGRVNYERRCSSRRPPHNAIDIDVKRTEDGLEFCYTLLPDPHWSLRLVDVATGQYQGLPGDLYSLSPTWDPLNSQHLIYDGERGLVNLDMEKRLTSAFTDDFNDHSPVYSPDGSKLAVTHRQAEHWEIHLLNADGGGRVQLTGTSYITWAMQALNGDAFYSYNNASPTWSPDGSQLAFLTDRSGRWEIWVMNVDGTEQRALFPPGTLDGIPLQYNGVDEQMIAWQ